jgi:NhaA family Na+:H+ antiporter
LIVANSALAPSYFDLLHAPVRVGVGGSTLDKGLQHWINDGLMVLFFFVVGLEIKRELLVGELATPRRAALPLAAALGGMLLPALCYAALNVGGPGLHGWGVPMATDIAFALGVLGLLGTRVPPPIFVFLAALAIIDDLGAVLVIALFYSEQIAPAPLTIGVVILALSYLCNRLGVRSLLVYSLLGIALWLAFLESGVHATIAGVLLAMTIPTRAGVPGMEFKRQVERLLGKIENEEQDADPLARVQAQQALIHELEQACERVQTPLQRLEHTLHPWVTYLILPMFAFANAGVALPVGQVTALLAHPVTLGVVLGLVLGKQGGILALSWLAVRLGWADLPRGVDWRQLWGVSWLGGIGFTMSVFIATLAFAEAELLTAAKIGILIGSLIAGMVGFYLLRLMLPERGGAVDRRAPAAAE